MPSPFRSIGLALLLAFGGVAFADEHTSATQRQWSTLSSYGKVLTSDQAVLLKKLRRFPSAVVSLGGARIKPGDPAYATSQRIGYLLAKHSLPSRTGGGPGIMEGVPSGMKLAIAEQPIAGSRGKTQGVNIALPFEQKLNPLIDLSTTAQEFPYRKVALYTKARGYLAFPGGYGTLDEVFQFWNEKTSTKSRVPFVLVDSTFWKPFVATLKKVSAEHGNVISAAEWQSISVLDRPEHIVATMAKSTAHEPIPSDDSQQRGAASLARGIEVLEHTPRAIGFVGGANADEARIVAEAAHTLTAQKQSLRVGSTGGITDAVLHGASGGKVYGFVRQGDAQRPNGLDVVHESTDSTVHDVLLTSNLRGLVATPGGLPTLRTVFNFLTQVQNGKVPRVPIVLVGTKFWTPIFETMKAQMLTSSRQLIQPSDLDLVTITDDASVVSRAFHTAPTERSAAELASLANHE